MAWPKGSPNKITADFKDKLQLVMDNAESHFDISDMTTDQKIKIFQGGLQYLVPKLNTFKMRKKSMNQIYFLQNKNW